MWGVGVKAGLWAGGGAYEDVDVLAEVAVGVRFGDALDGGAGVELGCCGHGEVVGV